MTAGAPTDLATSARDHARTVRDGVMPYWRKTAPDTRHGGYLLRDYGSRSFPRVHRWRARRHADKLLMGQARTLWTFAHAHHSGIDPDAGNLEAARVGYEFLRRHFADPESGGWLWETTVDGRVLDDRKSLCGHAMVIYALVEYGRATGTDAPVGLALETFATIERQLRDHEHGGWHEGASRTWGSLDPTRRMMVGTIGVKSDNVYLHVMEALAELLDATGDDAVRASLEDTISLIRTYFFPDDPSGWTHERHVDWSPVVAPEPAFSYGHAVEFAWLLLRAEEVLGVEPSVDFLAGTVDHALRYSWDAARGGLYGSAPLDGPSRDTDKYWWAQAEMLAALVDLSLARPGPRYQDPARQLLAFVDAAFADPRDGVWREAVHADGSVLKPAKAHNWVGGYHDLRALVKLWRAYGDG